MKTLSYVLEWHREKPVQRKRDLSSPPFLRNLPLLFFDGVAASVFCVVGFVLKLVARKEIKCWLNARRGSNTRAKVIDLWSGLFVAKLWGVKDLHVVGDSQVIICWASPEE